MAFGMSPFPLQFGSRGAAGDPTALTQYNVDARLTALGLTQAGTGTTWGETGQAATPLYAVEAAKVPLAVETINGKRYFGPIVNPAGTNLALYSSDATNAAWVKTGCTAALALGGLEHDADWRGPELIANGTLDTDLTSWSNGNSHWSVVSGRAYHASSSSANLLAQAVTTAGKFYELTFDYDVIEGSANARSNSIIVATGLTGSGTHTVIIPGGGAVDFYRSASPSEFYIDNVSVREVDAHTLITATGNNATCLQSITSTSGERVTKWWMQTDDEDVFVSHGAPMGSALYEDAFGSDTSGEWTRGTNSVDGVLDVSGGVLRYTIGAGDNNFPRYTRTVAGFTVGKLYALRATVAGTASFRVVRVSMTVELGDVTPTAPVFYFKATQTTATLSLLTGNSSAGQTVTADDISVYEVAETELTPGANPVPVDLAAYTGANPQLGIRIATSGDSVRLYGVQHQVAARALRPRIGPTAGSTVTTGARTLSRTLSVAPPAISLSLVVPWSGISDTFLVQVDDGTLNNRIAVLVDNLGAGVAKLRAVKSGSLTDRTISGVLTPGDAIMFDIEWTATHIRGRVNGGAWGDITHTTIPTFTTMTLGNVTGFNVQWRRPILAFRDNLGNLLPAPYGWNTSLLDNWT